MTHFAIAKANKHLKILALIAGDKSVTFIRKKEKWTNQGNDKHVCTNFQNPTSYGFLEIFDTDFPVTYFE